MAAELTADVAETHVSVVFFVADRAYKLKKPVALEFLDFSTREARRAVCHREVELNRRLAPDVYLGVADVLGPDGEACDHLVVMRRMPAERRLSTLVRRGSDVDVELRSLAHLLATFHSQARRSPEIDAAAGRDAVAANWEQNFRQLAPFVGPVLDNTVADRVQALARRYLAGRGALFDRRIAEGRARDGHGDLLADDIFFLDDGPRVLDCIEFDDRLRYGDVLNDVCFLAMDLEDLGAPEAARRFLAFWGELTAETHPSSLADHYIAYRAHVRAKVACFRHAQGDERATPAAPRLLALARDHLERARVRLVLVGGFPGTGKSTVAAGVADHHGWTLIGSDVTRKQLAGLPAGADRGAPYGEGLYRPEMTAATYATLLDRAATSLANGESVVLDATWTDAARRAGAAAVAAGAAADLVELRCDAPAAVAATRLAARPPGAAAGSDATAAVAETMRRDASPWPTATVIDTSGDERDAVAAAITAAQ